ncbi:hypothetical protein COY27_03660 [Candidatus Woesearchaeota archaeon CG_4_10_14_0_2_um_filter_33_13]|nr:MAG: hypothetical protein COY27_03660 [Candidatus Woesearchaeota archaeon CG_4_10_14_0_2_um_filter_33_13]
MRLSKSRSAQMEMIGLVIIVILISLGMLFAAQFALKENPQKKIFTRKGLSYSTMSALMKTTVYEPGCEGDFKSSLNPQIGKDLLEDCARNKGFIQDNGFSLYRCRNQHTCIFLREFISEMLNETLGGWNKNYEFTSELIQAESDVPQPLFEKIVGSHGGCYKKERDSSGLFPIHTESGLVQSQLLLCD